MDLTSADALRLSAMLERREVSVAELMAATLDRIDAVNPKLNAIVSLRDRGDLMAEAHAADQAPRRGWLHGIPLAVKDLVAVAGMPFTEGSPLYADRVPSADDGLARRLKGAGAILIGKTNVPEFGLGSHTTNPVFGPTRNPYDQGLSAGGSSGGAGAALAARMVAVADGSDMMGSLRNPAAWNNVYGLRPSVGLVPGEVQDRALLHRLSTLGPMARNPRDLAALLGTLSGREMAIGAVPSTPRIGWLGDWGGAYAFAPGLLDLADTALQQMVAMDWQVDAVAPPVPAPLLWDSWTDLRSFVLALGHGADWHVPERRAQLNAQTRWEVARGLALTGARVEAALAERATWLAAAQDLFAQFDALILPATQLWPFPVDTHWPEEIMGTAMDTYHRWMEVVVPASLGGFPALAIPAGFGASGLPGGLQMIGAPGQDAQLLALAAAWHDATDWPGQKPPSMQA